ncbi:MAG: NfeD family protein [Gammaproteobacteria bacterium]|nr:NfeD family protein [Gammaproteobacteria bacterium]NNJ84910.1 NfeD family protein [Gammaproteobacteria bacterium]
MIELTYWHWWILAAALIAFEIFSPLVIFLWMGAAAGIVGLALLFAPEMDWEYQVLLFSVFSIASIVGWRWYLRKNPTQTDRPVLNRRGEQYTGRVFTLAEPIIDGRGRVRVGDSMWTIAGEDCPANTKVRVSGVDGNVLRVAPMN